MLNNIKIQLSLIVFAYDCTSRRNQHMIKCKVTKKKELFLLNIVTPIVA